jgi:hypothetical protein
MYWNGLYGINDMSMEEVVELGRSWAYAPELTLKTKDVSSSGYDLSERCYQLENKGQKPKTLEFELSGSKENPVLNPAFVIKNWKADNATILVNGKKAKDARVGINRELEGNDLVVFLFLERDQPVSITIAAE